MTAEVALRDAMLCWNSGLNGGTPAFSVVPHPDERGASDRFDYSVGACFTRWRNLDERGQKLQLMVDTWHIVAFYGVPVALVREGLLVIPEYREMLASDCLPIRFQNESGQRS
jgi:hypothetical protein